MKTLSDLQTFRFRGLHYRLASEGIMPTGMCHGSLLLASQEQQASGPGYLSVTGYRQGRVPKRVGENARSKHRSPMCGVEGGEQLSNNIFQAFLPSPMPSA